MTPAWVTWIFGMKAVGRQVIGVSEVSKFSPFVCVRIVMPCGCTTMWLPQRSKWKAPMSTETSSKTIGLSELLSKRMAPASNAVAPLPRKVTPGDPCHGKGKMLPAGRRPSA